MDVLPVSGKIKPRLLFLVLSCTHEYIDQARIMNTAIPVKEAIAIPIVRNNYIGVDKKCCITLNQLGLH